MDAKLPCFIRCGSHNASPGCTAADNDRFADEIGIFNALNGYEKTIEIKMGYVFLFFPHTKKTLQKI
jgi:hypothetical protein